MNHLLDADKVIDTAAVLSRRVHERFPASGLTGIGNDLLELSRRSARMARELSKPQWPLRLAACFVTLAMLVLLGLAFQSLRVDLRVRSVTELTQGVEALINNLVFAGIAVWFAFSLETRRKRRQALQLVAQLRSVAHVIDMHQLTKDPERLEDLLPPTEHSPARLQLTPPLLMRYLNYCTEMLSILSKLAALQVQTFGDPVSLEAVTDLEDLTTGLSRKIWQKIMILDRIVGNC
jgi:hypothetical protein